MKYANEIKTFLKQHYRHFNAAALLDAAEGYRKFVENGGSMFLAMAGAMSSAELGLSLAEMIRREKIHAISCTGARAQTWRKMYTTWSPTTITCASQITVN
jgi:deoxyhypusine synthase